MSMAHSTFTRAQRNAHRIYGALLFSRYVQRRREDLGLSVQEAAHISGMEVSDWCALEGGRVPAKNDPLLCSVAETELELISPNSALRDTRNGRPAAVSLDRPFAWER